MALPSLPPHWPLRALPPRPLPSPGERLARALAGLLLLPVLVPALVLVGVTWGVAWLLATQDAGLAGPRE